MIYLFEYQTDSLHVANENSLLVEPFLFISHVHVSFIATCKQFRYKNMCC